jgi:hypothetical protein
VLGAGRVAKAKVVLARPVPIFSRPSLRTPEKARGADPSTNWVMKGMYADVQSGNISRRRMISC